MENVDNVAEVIDVLLGSLPERSRKVLEKRFGLLTGEKKHTLESIGQMYGITRERIRQIENSAKKIILDTDELVAQTDAIVLELKKTIDSFGGVASESEILKKFSDERDEQDHLSFLLHLSEPFYDKKMVDLKEKVWYTEHDSFEAFRKSLDRMYKDIQTDELLSESEIISRFSEKMKTHTDNPKLLEVASVKMLINLSKKIGSNSLGQWGSTESRNINAKGVKDYAFLILNSEEKPMHFRDIAEKISDRFSRNVNVATIHNELIKDKRFILVGRGKYGLATWDQFSGGTVAQVIAEVLKASKKALSKEEVIERVLEKKDVRKQTVVINLSSPKFRRTKDGRYALNKK